MIRKRGHRVPPTSIKAVRSLAAKLRSTFGVLGLNLKGKIDVVDVIEFALPKIMPKFNLEIVPDNELGEDHAQTYPDRLIIKVKQSVYTGACRGNGRDIFTLAHELGHLFLHRGVSAYARSNKVNNHKDYEDSEWQADCFAAEFLMPVNEVLQCRNEFEVQHKFGVSQKAAEVRFNKVKREMKR